MALTVPPPSNSYSQPDPFGWLFSYNNSQENSLYQDDDLMEFSDDNNNNNDNSGDYQQETPPYQSQIQQQEPTNSRCYSSNCDNFNMQNTVENQKYNSCIDLVESPSNSKDAWPAEYVKTILLGTSSIHDGNRKRKADWLQVSQSGEFANNLTESGSFSKVSNHSKDRERRKSQGRLAWPDDIDLDLSTELMNNNNYSNDSLLNFPNLTVFKQEVPSPPNQLQHHLSNEVLKKSSRSPGNPNGGTSGNSSSSSGLQNFLEQSWIDNNNGGNGAGNSNNNELRVQTSGDDCRFQYVLAAATSIATKSNEETLTYLNQGQSYEIKLKKLGDLSTCRGKIMKSVVKICFHERRLQYMEREQMNIWQSSRPGERILDIDIPLSYGLIHVNQSILLNTAEILWDPMKEVGVYIKVNCISTEFTPKKHGGEKGVPFRIQIETYLENGNVDNSPTENPASPRPLHAAACQIKVFKLKGADRKHKQDRERIQKRPLSEQEKFNRSYDCTILNDISSESLVTSTIGCYSPEIKRNISPLLPSSPIHVPAKFDVITTNLMTFCSNPIAIGNVSSTNGLCKIDQNIVASTQNYEMDDYIPVNITKDSTPNHLTQWLQYHRLSAYANTFLHFSGSDLLRMSKDDIIQICGLADGIRMFNILHVKPITPRLTIFVSLEANLYHAIYLHSGTTKELIEKLYKVPGINAMWTQFGMKTLGSSPSHSQLNSIGIGSGSNPNLHDESNFKIFINGPNNVLVLVTEEVLSNIKDESLFFLETNATNGSILMKSVCKTKSNTD
ncbi:unnamed protein product [Diamesa serratosioi]